MRIHVVSWRVRLPLFPYIATMCLSAFGSQAHYVNLQYDRDVGNWKNIEIHDSLNRNMGTFEAADLLKIRGFHILTR